MSLWGWLLVTLGLDFVTLGRDFVTFGLAFITFGLDFVTLGLDFVTGWRSWGWILSPGCVGDVGTLIYWSDLRFCVVANSCSILTL